ncbi:alpha/beta-hydrolase [Mycena polygramma]|nr:alpha/beta-hydrolase [Mycena polygramma]
MPTTAFGPDWQKYFEVTAPLPNVTGPIARSFAGNVGVNRADHPNATLFFWAFEKANGTLTGSASDTDPWIIWLNGGPGSSSMTGLMTENGPLRVTGTFSIVQNNFSWNRLADMFWVDQPVGTGYSTSDATGYVPDEDQVGRDFPYITKTIFSTPNPPVNLRKMIVGDGTLGSSATFENNSITQEHLCGYDLNFTYPQNGHFPTLKEPTFGLSTDASKKSKQTVPQNARPTKWSALQNGGGRPSRREALAGLPNGTLNPAYGCFIYHELLDYAQNFSFPWSAFYRVYDIPDGLNPEVPSDPTIFMNDNRTRAALHAPTSKDWLSFFDFAFGGDVNGTQFSDPTMVFLSELATNASEKGVGIVFYSGNDDSLNMTFGGVQAFTRKPATPFSDDKGNFAGIVHQERNLTYALFRGASHLVPSYVPEAAFVFVREFILGSNKTGLVDIDTGSVFGGEDPALAADAMPGGLAIFYGDGDSATTSLSTVAPDATLASCASFIATATSTGRSGDGSG